MKQGFDLELLQAVSEITALPIVASGGAGKVKILLSYFSCQN